MPHTIGGLNWRLIPNHLVIMCYRLRRGQSGSIVYVVKEETNELYVLGMLEGQQDKSLHDGSPPVYQCGLMWPAIHQVAHENRHKINNLCMVDREPGMVDHDSNNGATAVISSLKSIGPESGIDSLTREQQSEGDKAN